MKPDFHRIQSLLREAVTMLCKNSLPYKQELCVEGLLGITLDKEDIFLVNIKEILKPHEIVSPVDETDSSQLDIRERSSSPANYDQEDNGDRSVECSAVSTRAVVPIFKAPSKVQRSHKRAVSNSSELSHHWWTSLSHHGSGDPAVSDWEEGVSMPPHSKRRHLTSSHLPNSPTNTLDIDSLPVMEVKKEVLDDSVTSASITNYHFQHSTDNINSLSELNSYSTVHLSRGEAETKHILPVSLPSIAGLTSSSWHLGSGDVLSTSVSSLPNLSSDMVSAGLPSSHFNSSMNSASQLDATSTGSDAPLDPELLNKIQAAVLKDEGCFITSRMLCRRYSALFKVHHVVQAMQAMVLPPDDERHIGVFKFINERTKVFYKCPPCAIRPAALAAFGVTPAQYQHNFYRLPRNKSMKTDNWAVFVEHILRCNPYGPINMPDFLAAESTGSHPVQELETSAAVAPATQTAVPAKTTTTLAKSEKVEPVDMYDEFDIQCAVVQTDGCFASSRSLCRKNTYRVVNVIRAMTAMNRPRGHPLYIGTYVRVSERVKVFYKCPPHLVSAEALRLYGVDAVSYVHFYRRNPRPPERAMLNWTSYVEGIVRKWPFDTSLVPFESFQLPDVDVFRLRSVVGVDSRLVDDGRQSLAIAKRESPSFDPMNTAAETISPGTAEISPASLGDVIGVTSVSDAEAADRTAPQTPDSPRATDGGDGISQHEWNRDEGREEGGNVNPGAQIQEQGRVDVHKIPPQLQ